MNHPFALVGFALLAILVGCEGDTPRRSPFAATSNPTGAKPVEYAPVSKNAIPGVRPAGQGNPAAPVDPNPAADANPANTPVTINADKLETQRQLTGYHSAMFLAKEVGNVGSGPIDQNLNFVFRAGQGLEIRVKLPKAMDLYKAEKGKPPQTVADFINYLNEQTIVLPELKPNEFYIYDPALAGIDASKENLDYLKQYAP